MKTTTILSTLALAATALAKTDMAGCTSSQTIAYGGASLIFWVPGSCEICAFLDCGGGRAPPKTDVPGCPLYSGTASYSPSYLPNCGGATATATASASMSAYASASGSLSLSAFSKSSSGSSPAPASSAPSSPAVTSAITSSTAPAPVVTSSGTAAGTGLLSTTKGAGNGTVSTKSATPSATGFPGAAADISAKNVIGLILGAMAAVAFL